MEQTAGWGRTKVEIDGVAEGELAHVAVLGVYLPRAAPELCNDKTSNLILARYESCLLKTADTQRNWLMIQGRIPTTVANVVSTSGAVRRKSASELGQLKKVVMRLKAAGDAV